MEFIKVKEEHLELILKWRTSEFVTRFMYTDLPFDMEKQQEWYRKINNSPFDKYWIISSKEKLIGLVSINDINPTHKRATWAYYIGDPAFGMVGAMIGPYLYNYAFHQLDLRKLLGEVMAENGNVRKIHLMHGCREVGYYKDHIYKYGRYHDVYLFEMLASDWENQSRKYKKYVGLFED